MVVTLSPIVTFSILLLEAEKYVGTNPFAVEPTSGVLMTSLVIAEQLVNESSPMLLTLLPILTVSKLEQYSNTPSPMVVTLLGILTVFKLKQ